MLGGYAMTAITAITAQNTLGVQGVEPITPAMVARQIASCVEDGGVDAIKIGVLADAGVIAAAAEGLAGVATPIVLDPVMIATSGAVLVRPDAVAALRDTLFPRAALLTPNLPELAHLAGRDRLEFRLSHMTHAPSRLVLETVAKMSDWGSPRPGRARGVAFCLSFGVPTAEVIEVAQSPEGIRLTGAWAAVDVGVALDPRNIEAQVSGAMVYGLSAAMTGEITFAQGQVQQRNFPDYDGLRMGQCPDIQILVLQVGGRIRGIGEPGTPPAAPALANALFALTGTRARDLPLSRQFRFA